MNITFFGRVSSLLSLSALLMVCGTLSAQAETVDVTAASDSNSADTYSFSTASPVLFANQTESASPMGTIQVEIAPTEMTPATVADVSTDLPVETAKVAPVPGTTATSAQVLTEPTATPSSPVEAIAPTTETEAPKVAQSIEPGRATRSGSSYVGVGLNVGITGDTALGDTNFTVLSKIGLTPTISVRPSVMIGDDADILIPVTLDFPSYTADGVGISAAPYVGAGVAITTGDSDVVRLLLTGGVDVPLTPQFTATAAVNAAVFDDTDVGLLLGVGYNFTSR